MAFLFDGVEKRARVRLEVNPDESITEHAAAIADMIVQAVTELERVGGEGQRIESIDIDLTDGEQTWAHNTMQYRIEVHTSHR